MAMAYVLRIRFAPVPDRTCFRFQFQQEALNSDIRDDSELYGKNIMKLVTFNMSNVFYCSILLTYCI